MRAQVVVSFGIMIMKTRMMTTVTFGRQTRTITTIMGLLSTEMTMIVPVVSFIAVLGINYFCHSHYYFSCCY